MTTAAMSSGRVSRSAPFGALPTGVRTAETMTASFMSCALSSSRKVTEQVFERLADLLRLAVEQMIGRVDHDELLRLLELA